MERLVSQLCFDSLAFGYVRQLREVVEGRPCLVPDQGAVEGAPYNGAVGPHKTPFVRVGITARDPPGAHSLSDRRFVRMVKLIPVPPNQFVAGTSEQSANGHVHPNGNSRQVDNAGTDSCLIEGNGEKLLGVAALRPGPSHQIRQSLAPRNG